MYQHFGTQGRTHRLFHYPQALLLVVGAVALLTISIQHILHFAGFSIASLPRPSQGKSLSVVSLEDYENLVSSFYEQPITITLLQSTGKEPVTLTRNKSDLGFSILKDKIKTDAEQYSYRQSLIPFGSIIFSNTVDFADYLELDEATLRKFTNSLDAEHSTSAQDASISYPVGSQTPTINAGISGYKYGSDRLFDSIRSAVYGQFETVQISAAEIKPIISTEFITNNQSQLYSLLTKVVTFSDGQSILPLKGNNELLKTIQPNAQGEITFNTALLKAYLEKWVAPTYSQLALPAVTIQESGRRYEATQGKAVQVDQLVEAYKSALLATDQKPQLSITTSVVQPGAEQVTTSGSVLHLQKLVTELGSRHNAAILLDFLDDSVQSEIGYNVHESRIAASTYKLLVAYAVARDIDTGVLTWDSPSLGRSTKSCLESMLVYSTNHCAENWVKNVYGYAYMNELAAEIGLPNTCFQCADFSQASVHDQVMLMTSFYQHKGLSAESASVIVDMLKRQKYREGIPSVTKLPTMNKIGWVPGHYNDSAIIQTNRGPLALSIYTTSGSWAQIREITKEILTATGN